MIDLSFDEAIQAMGATAAKGLSNRLKRFPSVSTDTRTLESGQCFVCLQGPNFDAHRFIPEAVAKHAAVIVHSDPVVETAAIGAIFLRVADTLAALQQLGHYVRVKWGRPLVGITGSVGKTTTRIFTTSLLAGLYKVRQSHGNLNNQIGVPLSLLSLEGDDQVAVIEMGMNHAGEIRALARLAKPETVVLTNVAPVHLEFFSGLEEIAAAKGEILERLPVGGLIVYNGDDERLRSIVRRHPARSVSFGGGRETDVRIVSHRQHGLDSMDLEILTPAGLLSAAAPFAGRHFLYNLAAAVAVAVEFEVPVDEMATVIGELKPAAMRGRIVRITEGRFAGVTLWDDSYNANPHAMEGVLETVAGLRTFRRRIAALGDMLELGPSSPDWHCRVGQMAAQAGVELLVAVGKFADSYCEGARSGGMTADRVVCFRAAPEAADYLVSALKAGDFLLVKGSRGIAMDAVVRRIEGS